MVIILVVLSILIWVVRTVVKRKSRPDFWFNLILTLGIILFWFVYFGLIQADVDKMCGLAAVIYILSALAYWKH